MAMAEGSLDGVSAFMTGRLKVQGEMGLAMKLGALLT
jgi:putative sterol carrier protein